MQKEHGFNPLGTGRPKTSLRGRSPDSIGTTDKAISDGIASLPSVARNDRQGFSNSLILTGFTAIELLAVIAIILTIIGIGLPAYNSFRNRGKTAKAKAVIVKLEMALEMYKTDFGEYPGALDALINVSNPSFGPYMDSKDFSGGKFVDPWGTAYEYSKTIETVSILSYGPDKGKGTNDDISNITPW